MPLTKRRVLQRTVVDPVSWAVFGEKVAKDVHDPRIADRAGAGKTHIHAAAKEFEPTAWRIRKWVAQMKREEGTQRRSSSRHQCAMTAKRMR